MYFSHYINDCGGKIQGNSFLQVILLGGLWKMFRATFRQGKKMKKSTVTVRYMAQPYVLLSFSSSSANGLTSGGPSILALRLPSVSQMMLSGLFWLLTCFIQPLPSWWPCGFTATPIFSSRSPPFLGRQVCPTASRRTPSTKINSLLMLSDLLS